MCIVFDALASSLARALYAARVCARAPRVLVSNTYCMHKLWFMDSCVRAAAGEGLVLRCQVDIRRRGGDTLLGRVARVPQLL